jgi:DNA polymerase-1
MIQVLIDFSYLAHRAYHAMQGLTHDDYATGVLFGFFEQLRTICYDYRVLSNEVHLFTDSRQSYRKRLFPDYKRKRHQDKTEEEQAQAAVLHTQMDTLIDLLPTMGFPVYRQTGLESDDLIAQAALQLHRAGQVGVMVTADGDLYQTITPQISWWDPARDVWMNPTDFYMKKHVHTIQWASVKALAGCHTDGVPGVPGVGEKTAVQYITGNMRERGTRWASIQGRAGLAVVERNLELVTLPHPKTRPVELKAPDYTPAAFFAFCSMYGVASYLEDPRRRQWGAFFAGRFGDSISTPRRRGEIR